MSDPTVAPSGEAPLWIVYFGTDWAAENRTSAHQVARWLAASGHEIEYYECPGLRPPSATGRDLRRSLRKLMAALGPARRVHPNVQVRTILQLPLHGNPLARRLNRWLLGWTAARIRQRGHGRQVVSWFALPHLPALAANLGEALCVYYCVDEYSALPGVDSAAVASLDQEMRRTASLVFVTSATLRQPDLPGHAPTFVAPHGVDLTHFRRATGAGMLPPEYDGIPAPRIGFFGLIEAWIDTDLIGALARRRPDWQFVLIGRVAVPTPALDGLANVHLIGRRDYEQLPDYGRGFAISIIPYRLTRQVEHANPIKLREYLAMERPIVSVPTPELRRFADLVTLVEGSDVDGWERTIAAALSAPPTAGEREAMRAATEGMSWDARMTRVMRIVRTALAGKAPDAEEAPR